MLTIIVLGDSGVGKTALIRQFNAQPFLPEHKPTFGAEKTSKTLALATGGQTEVLIWDTSGGDASSLNADFFREAHACLLVFDLTKRSSFEAINSWRKDFLANAAPTQPDVFPIVVVGTKCDTLAAAGREVFTEEARQWCASHNARYFETSAKDGSEVANAFQHLVSAAHTEQSLSGNSNDPSGKAGQQTADTTHPVRIRTSVHGFQDAKCSLKLDFVQKHAFDAAELKLLAEGKEKGRSTLVHLDFRMTGYTGQKLFVKRFVRGLQSFRSYKSGDVPISLSVTFPDASTCRLSLVVKLGKKGVEALRHVSKEAEMAGDGASAAIGLGWSLETLAKNWKAASWSDLLKVNGEACFRLSKKHLEGIPQTTAKDGPMFREKPVPPSVTAIEGKLHAWARAAVKEENPLLDLPLQDFVKSCFDGEVGRTPLPKLDSPIADAEAMKKFLRVLHKKAKIPILRLALLTWGRDFLSVDAVHVRTCKGHGFNLQLRGFDCAAALDLVDVLFPDDDMDAPGANEPSNPIK